MMPNTPNQPSGEAPAPRWIDASKNSWHVPILDVRPVTLRMLSMSRDPSCAKNAISFKGDDGRGFIGVKPQSSNSVATSLRYPIDRFLADGVLFVPDVMEHKWAIYLHARRIIFIRSWSRQVTATAEIESESSFVRVKRINGAFTTHEETSDFAVRVTDYLIRTHALNVPFPAPLPAGMEKDPKSAALWCMSVFGKMAEFATSEILNARSPSTPLRTHSLLHIAVARGDRGGVIAQLDAGVPADLLAKDGLTPLHWALAGKHFEIAELLLAHGCPVDVRSDEGATPLMNAIQARDVGWTDFFLSRGADPNERDTRGFTALHRAAEMGEADLVRRLLSAGARVDVKAEGHTPLSLARGRNQMEVVKILDG